MNAAQLMQVAREANAEAARLSEELSKIDDRARDLRDDFASQRGGAAERGEIDKINALYNEEAAALADLERRKRELPYLVYAARLKAVESEMAMHTARIREADADRLKAGESMAKAKEKLDAAQAEYDKHKSQSEWLLSSQWSNEQARARREEELEALRQAGPEGANTPHFIPAGFSTRGGV